MRDGLSSKQMVFLGALAADLDTLERRVQEVEKVWDSPVARAAAHCEQAGVKRSVYHRRLQAGEVSLCALAVGGEGLCDKVCNRGTDWNAVQCGLQVGAGGLLWPADAGSSVST